MEDDYERFVGERADALLRYGYLLTGNPHDAADLVQEGLVRLRGAWSRVRRKHDPERYVRTTMTRLHVNIWRLRRREQLSWDLPEEPVTDVHDDGSVWKVLETLPKKQRAVLVLRYYEDLSDAEIAEIMGISRGTVRSQASRALDKLRATELASLESTR
ncbi:SigE family RNA polymerase sigma factor [Microtetraspora sp. NBRC 16547]|uniref:SigE family RNA polymerase sigma factor n=1 Tax=Microtetraspora sp. NBRC 16547 TaxID=3030993 RepID=UPI002556B3FE|nr:SigE family RNA polymerase sigma factor [Microtetraspora sp. NBRC 16547]